ncbi:MAG: ferritin-like domain-containing protein [Actinomycetota bacterium]|nr:ferritin-like domain-containing protein [Actinomycetota bacterium]
MAQSAGLHEDSGALSGATKDRHRALASLQEELEAVDWYDQRVDAAGDDELRAILAHNRDEEKEHAAMVLEWLRRRDPVLESQLRTYLFTSGQIVQVEEAASEEHGERDGRADGSLGIGGLRGVAQ